jgi:hypothetical protein
MAPVVRTVKSWSLDGLMLTDTGLPPNPRRKILYFSPHNSARYGIGFGEVGGLGVGLNVQVGSNILILRYEDIGEMLLGPITVSSNAAAQIGVLEVSGD